MPLQELQEKNRVNLVFSRDSAEKLQTVAEMLGGFENYGQVCRYLINRGLEGMASQIATYETQRKLKRILDAQGAEGQELFDFMRKAIAREGEPR